MCVIWTCRLPCAIGIMAFSIDTLVNVSFEGRTLQLRDDQLTLETISKAFRLVPATVLLVSERGTIAVAHARWTV